METRAYSAYKNMSVHKVFWSHANDVEIWKTHCIIQLEHLVSNLLNENEGEDVLIWPHSLEGGQYGLRQRELAVRGDPLQSLALAARTTGASAAGGVVAVAGVGVLASRLVGATQLLLAGGLLGPEIGKILLGAAAHDTRRVVGRWVMVPMVLGRLMVGDRKVVQVLLVLLVLLAQLVEHGHRFVRVEAGWLRGCCADGQDVG